MPKNQPNFPLLALIVSGGHSQLAYFTEHGRFELIGQTQDDAVGEAFDKVAKIIGLPYPGGPSIAKAAELGDPHAFTLPIAKLQGKYDFSFSGLKTAVLRAVQREVGKDFSFPSHELPGLVNDELRHNMAASFQYTAIRTLVQKTKLAYDALSPASVVIAGGVAANQELRRQLAEALPTPIEYAPIQLCTDNAAMIAALGYYRAQIDAPVDPLDVEVQPSLSMLATLGGPRYSDLCPKCPAKAFTSSFLFSAFVIISILLISFPFGSTIYHSERPYSQADNGTFQKKM
jgi:N6-L-threonylcarbamoyladenine synthase